MEILSDDLLERKALLGKCFRASFGEEAVLGRSFWGMERKEV